MRRWQLTRQPVGSRQPGPATGQSAAAGGLAWVLLPWLLLAAGCGGVRIAPQPVLPKALVQPVPAHIGFVLPPDQKEYAHNETRGGAPWSISLGEGQRKLAREVFKASFRSADEFEDLEAAKRAAGLQAIFEARLEQYSFATARETGGDYVAVTIRYRILLRTPRGEPFDTYTLTGYGNSPGGGMSSGAPLDLATRAAMRDAAAKFLTQFPEQPVAKLLASGQPLLAAATAALPAMPEVVAAVPIRESRRGKSGAAYPAPPPPVALPEPGTASAAEATDGTAADPRDLNEPAPLPAEP